MSNQLTAEMARAHVADLIAQADAQRLSRAARAARPATEPEIRHRHRPHWHLHTPRPAH